MNDDAISRSLQRQDPDIMSYIIPKYSRLLWPIADAVLKNTGTDQDTEECVADTFIQLWQYPEKYDPCRGSLKSYLCILVRSRALDRYRQLTRHSTVPLEEINLFSGLDLDKRLLQKQAQEQVRRLLDTLDAPAKDILLRRYEYDQKPRQIALALGLTPKQVNDILYRTKKQLRQQLSMEGGIPWDE